MPSAAGLVLFEGVSTHGCTPSCVYFRQRGGRVPVQTFPRLPVIFYEEYSSKSMCVCCVTAHTSFKKLTICEEMYIILRILNSAPAPFNLGHIQSHDTVFEVLANDAVAVDG